jgi:hypothetical protein
MPSLAQIDLSLIIVKKLTTNAKGGPNTIEIPARSPIPKIPPHPKPGILRICAAIKNHGANASPKLIFPAIVEFIFLSSFVVYSLVASFKFLAACSTLSSQIINH